MPRIFAKVNAGIWGDPDFRSLPPAAQHLYLTLWTSPDLSFCGVHDWRPARLTGLSAGLMADHVRLIANCLEARHFIVTDDSTEEVLIRSWARFDEVVKQPRLAISYVNAYSTVSSPEIRQVLVHEAHKMQKLWPELACWNDSRVTDILGHPAVSAKALALPDDPFGDGFGLGLGLGLPQTQAKVSGSVSGSVSVPPTTTTTTNNKQTNNKEHSAGKPAKAKAQPLPQDWVPTDEHKQRVAKSGVDLGREVQKFKAHAEANARKAVVWNAAFTQWLIQAEERGGGRPSPVRHLPTVDELELPPDGLSPEQYAEWDRTMRERRAVR